MKSALFVLALGSLVFVVGCGRGSHDHDHDHNHDHGHDHGHNHSHGHAHVVPHGGTAVVLGDEAFHLEFVREADAGKLTVYVLDAEMEEFVRIAAPALELVATVGGQVHTLRLQPVENRATGETIGDTSQFEAQAEWLKTADTFDATLTAITVRGATFERVQFEFPTGHDGH